MKPLNSQPINWGGGLIADRSGEYMGGTMASFGKLTGDAISEYAAKERERREKKDREENAINFLKTSSGGQMDDKQAGSIVRGIGVDNFIKLREADMRNEALRQNAESAKLDALQLQAKAAEKERQAIALLRGMAEAVKQQVPPSGPMALFPAGGVTGGVRDPQGRIDPAAFMQMAAVGGADPGEIQKMLAAINAANDGARNSTPFEPRIVALPDGTKTVMTSPNSAQVLPAAKDEPKLKIGERQTIAIGGKEIDAEYVGNGKWVDHKTKAPLYVNMDSLFPSYPQVNPMLTGEGLSLSGWQLGAGEGDGAGGSAATGIDQNWIDKFKVRIKEK